jgi:hypothetical protein
MHRCAQGHLDGLQIELACLTPLGKDEPDNALYLFGDLALDGFRRFFSCALGCRSGAGRKRQICSLTSSRSRTNCWKRWNSATSRRAFSKVAGVENVSEMVLPFRLRVRRKFGP